MTKYSSQSCIERDVESLLDEKKRNHDQRQHHRQQRRIRTISSTSFQSIISSNEGIPTVVALKGGVRGGHSIVSSSRHHAHERPLGLSPTDYLNDSLGGGNTTTGMSQEQWPKGLTNVGNTCYANAALQCLLSTALTSALLDPKTVPILRRYSSNPNLLAMGSGSVDSSDEDESDDDTAGTSKSKKVNNSVDYGVDIDDEEDGIFLDSRTGAALDKSFTPTQQPRLPPTVIATARKKLLREQKRKEKKAKKKKKKDARRAKSEDAAKRKERERQRLEENCKWITTELTSIAQEYMEDSSSCLRQSFASGGGTGNTNGSGGRGGSSSRGTGGYVQVSSSSSSVMNWLSSSYNSTLSSTGRGGGGGDQQQDGNYGIVNPGSITRHPNRLSQCLSPYQQEDAHEFMRALLSNLVMNGHNRQLSSLFDGLLESSVTCQTCGRASLTRDRYMDLSVDINDVDIKTLDDALFEFTKDELLTDDNAVFCQKCRTKRSVTKGLRLATAPSILVCHLKRFAFNDYGRLVRLHKRIEFPQRLEIGDYMSNLNKARPPPYDLVGVLVHQGQTCASGHYLSFVKKNGEWFKCNDSEVTKVEESTVMMQQAYILMYEVAEMRENACFLPKPFRKEGSVMSTIESSDDATLSKGDFSVCGSYYSASDKSSRSKHSYHRGDGHGNGGGIGSYNPYNQHKHTMKKNTKNIGGGGDESTSESIMRVLREAGVTRFMADICCDSANTAGLHEPETRVLNDTHLHGSDEDGIIHNNDSTFVLEDPHFSNNNINTSRRYAHECESVDTQDSLIRRQSLMNSTARQTPINVLEVTHQHKSRRNKHTSNTTNRRNHRSQTAPRQRGDSFLENTAFRMVTPFSTFTPRADGGSGNNNNNNNSISNGVNIRTFGTSNEANFDGGGSVSSRSTMFSQSDTITTKGTLRDRERERRERHTFASTRYSMSGTNEDKKR